LDELGKERQLSAAADMSHPVDRRLRIGEVY
jgi:hypothetical protein